MFARIVRALVSAALVVAAFSSLWVGVSGARQTAGQQPVPCTGESATDPAGDQKLTFFSPEQFPGQPSTGPAPKSTDITSVFFRRQAGRTTANLRLSEFARDLPSGVEGVSYFVFYAVDGQGYAASAEIDRRGIISYYLHTYDPGRVTGTRAMAGGTFYEGTPGVVSIALPASKGGTEAAVLDAISSRVFVRRVGVSSEVADRAPDDEGDGQDYTATPCPEPSPAALMVVPDRRSFDALRTNETREVGVPLKAGEVLTDLTASVTQAGRRIALVRVAKLEGRQRVAVRLGDRSRAKPGNAILELSARRADGSRAARTFAIRFR